MEGQEVATADIPGAFLHTNYDKGDIHIKLEGAMFTLLEEIDPEYYKDFIFTDKSGSKCMYAESKKAIYGTLEASLLFWAKRSKSLEEMGYQRNEYKDAQSGGNRRTGYLRKICRHQPCPLKVSCYRV